MKSIILSTVIIFLNLSVSAQNVPIVEPVKIFPLDFDQAKIQWELREQAMHKMSEEGLNFDELNKEEQSAFMEYGEVYSGIWDIVGSACSWYCGGGVKEVSASSYLKSQGSNSYEPINAHDLNYENAWVEGVQGYGKGEKLVYTFSGANPRITDIIVVNGYVKSESSYKNNSRVKKLKVYLGNQPLATLNLRDTIANQWFSFEPIGTQNRASFEEMKKLPDWTLTFEIVEVYKGEKYDDTVISEIYFNGTDVHCFAAGTEILMADNQTKNIEDLQIGDSILYHDFTSKELKKARIEKLEKVNHHDLVTYHFDDGTSITGTQDHPFQVKNKGWSSLNPQKSKQYQGFDDINMIEKGDEFLTKDSRKTLTEIEYLKGHQETYTISKLTEGDNFIANEFIVGVEVLKPMN
ncbi:Hint domain-containing homing endonuclease [Marivirga tractuosa]|uniref:NADase-type glycan-binding domain-containing protein n=1 Tax=Marivirga tractuosa TaxID=1006 RepID=UPI0035CF9729